MLASRLWLAYSLCWLLVLGLAAVWLVSSERNPLRLVGGLVGLGALAAVYVTLTLRYALTRLEWQLASPEPALLRRRVLLLAAMLLLVLFLLTVIPGAGPWWLMLYPVIGAGLSLPTAPAVVSMVMMIALAFASGWLVSGRAELTVFLQGIFGFSAIIVRQLTLVIGELEATREQVARLAVSEERLRFARDLHDVLGHSLSLIVLKSELARRLLANAPTRAASEIGELEHVARQALREVRLAVAGYRQPTLAAELSAAQHVLAAAGIATSVDQPSDPLPQALDSLAAWIIREAVTNVVRHSRARTCGIRIARSSDEVTVSIVDDGTADMAVTSNGSGLAGLRERTAAAGGTLWAGPRPGGGFELRVSVPAAGARE